MNTEFARIGDIVIKLKYAFDPSCPRIEVYLDCEEAEQKGWEIYGPPEDRYQSAMFRNVNDEVELDFDHKKIFIKYIGKGFSEVTYQKTGKEMVPYVDLSVRSETTSES